MPSVLQFFLNPELKQRGIVFESPRRGDAGFDLRAGEDTVITAGKQVVISTGLHLAIPEGWVGLVKDRSSMASRGIYTHGGVIDAGYRGEIKIFLSNSGSESFQIEQGNKIAQLVITPCLTESIAVEKMNELGTTARGTQGFGSTGK